MAELKNIVSFFCTQAEDAKREQKKLDQKSMSELFQSGDVALGYIHDVLPEYGLVILKFYKLF